MGQAPAAGAQIKSPLPLLCCHGRTPTQKERYQRKGRSIRSMKGIPKTGTYLQQKAYSCTLRRRRARMENFGWKSLLIIGRLLLYSRVSPNLAKQLGNTMHIFSTEKEILMPTATTTGIGAQGYNGHNFVVCFFADRTRRRCEICSRVGHLPSVDSRLEHQMEYLSILCPAGNLCDGHQQFEEIGVII